MIHFVPFSSNSTKHNIGLKYRIAKKVMPLIRFLSTNYRGFFERKIHYKETGKAVTGGPQSIFFFPDHDCTIMLKNKYQNKALTYHVIRNDDVPKYREL